MAMDSSDISALASLPILKLRKLFEWEKQMRISFAYTLAIAVCFPLSARTADTVCKQDPSSIYKVLSDTRAALTVFSKKIGEEKCEAFRRRLFSLVMARAVLSVCKSGTDRTEGLSQFDQVIEDVNTGIADSCR